jgi:hypothetical protein
MIAVKEVVAWDSFLMISFDGNQKSPGDNKIVSRWTTG